MHKKHEWTTDNYPRLRARDLIPGNWDDTPLVGRLTLGTDTIGTTSVTRDHVTITSNGMEEQIALAWTEQPYGARARFLCPQCGKRRDLLYVMEGHWRCRVCLNLAYRTSQASKERRHDLALAKIVHDLGGTEVETIAGMTIPPAKPRYMHWKTYNEVIARIDAHDAALLWLWLQPLAKAVRN